jgi:Uma2 family endonuclease
MTWLEVCNDKNLRNLPYKIELNQAGQIVMSPTRNWHGYFASKIARILAEKMPEGETLVECAVETQDGAKVADAAWVSAERFQKIKDEPSCSIAPEICAEVTSPTNSAREIARKCELYLAAGATEYWVCDQQGALTFFDPSGKIPHSRLCPQFPQRLASS